jgi:hypothetical protein
MTGREHTSWCAGGHRCALGEHRADPHTITSPGAGSATITRIRRASGVEYAEIRLRINLPYDEHDARTRLASVVTFLWTQRIEAMLSAHPRGLLAIRTGTVAGLAVVDIDPRNGGGVDVGLMPATACVATGGGGWHLYYRHPGGALAPALADRLGVDVKADGGYVVAPPSVHPRTGRPYRWVRDRPMTEMAPALVALCRPPKRPTVTAPTGPISTRRAISSPDALLASILADPLGR